MVEGLGLCLDNVPFALTMEESSCSAEDNVESFGLKNGNEGTLEVI